jgi:hypothetical protein
MAASTNSNGGQNVTVSWSSQPAGIPVTLTFSNPGIVGFTTTTAGNSPYVFSPSGSGSGSVTVTIVPVGGGQSATATASISGNNSGMTYTGVNSSGVAQYTYNGVTYLGQGQAGPS